MSDPRSDRVVIYEDHALQFRWRRIAANGEIISTSGESYTRRHDCERAARRVNREDVVYLFGPEDTEG